MEDSLAYHNNVIAMVSKYLWANSFSFDLYYTLIDNRYELQLRKVGKLLKKYLHFMTCNIT